MIVANSFDLWQKDAFFSAAEEVQESADRLESTYRTWVRERKASVSPDFDELSRELQTALGTAKWQLEEFDKAVRFSRKNCSEDNSTTRHRQFVAAIESQIFHIETALREYLDEDRKQPLHWVNLNEEERDDLAIFLSGTSGSLSTSNYEYANNGPSMACSARENQCSKDEALYLSTCFSSDCKVEITSSKDVFPINKDDSYIAGLQTQVISGTRDDMNYQVDRRVGLKSTGSLPNFKAVEILIPSEDDQNVSSIEATPKEKGFKPALWNLKQMFREHFHMRGHTSYIQSRRISRFNQLFGNFGVFQRQLHIPQRLQFNCSVQVMLVLMLTIFLMVPFVFYSA